MNAISKECLLQLLNDEVTPAELIESLDEMEYDFVLQTLSVLEANASVINQIMIIHSMRKAFSKSVTA